MSEEALPQAVSQPSSADASSARHDASELEVKETAVANGTSNGMESPEIAKEVAPVTGGESKGVNGTTDKQPISSDTTRDKPKTTNEDVEMKEDIKQNEAATALDEAADPTIVTPTSDGKSKARRKSGGVPEHKNKKLNRKASKAKITHTNAKPGDYFFVKLKGYPLWPAIICDETMLPAILLEARPVTAARADGTYREEYADGGKKVSDRTFPVMYLHTNEFGWIPNYDLVELDFDIVADKAPKSRKDLHAAYQLAAEKHDLAYYKTVLQEFQEQRQAENEAKAAAQAAKKASKGKRKSKAIVSDEGDEDAEMVDAAAEANPEDGDVVGKEKLKSKKRKADEESNTPQRSDSVKKPKTMLKLTNTPKTANGIAIPKPAKGQSAAKPAKSKPKKTTKVKEASEEVAAKEPELTAEEKRVKKEKEILFLRHKLQKGLLTRDQEPKEEEMKQMSEFVSKLEGYADLEVSIIRATKINKVLKAILKLSTIPKEEEFKFKSRSQTLLDKWNKLLASDQDIPVAPVATSNGVGGDNTKVETGEAKEATNGTKEATGEGKAEDQATAVEAPVMESKEIPAVENTPALPVKGSTKDSTANTVKSTA